MGPPPPAVIFHLLLPSISILALAAVYSAKALLHGQWLSQDIFVQNLCMGF